MTATDDLDTRVEAAYATLPRARFGGRGVKVEEDRDVYAAAVDRTRLLYERYDEVLVAFSGGKDSTCVLNVAVDAARQLGRLPVKVHHWDEEAIPHEVEHYVRRLTARPDLDLDWFCLPVRHRNSCDPANPFWFPWAPEAEHLWCRPLPPEALTETRGCPPWWTFVDTPDSRPFIPVAQALFTTTRPGSVCMLLGNRAQESLRRRSLLMRRSGEDSWVTHQTKYGAKSLWVAYPIYDWTAKDVWTAIGRFGWDYCEFYDVMEMLGIPHTQQRIGPPYADEPLAQLWRFREADPALWDRMSLRVPGANTAAMYARTTLYGYGANTDETGVAKPDDITWEEYIAQAIRQHDPATRRKVARWIGMFIGSHYRKTSDPILDVPHPVTALSWPWLYRSATRGDTKERREPPYTLDRDVFRRRFIAYQDALARHQEQQHP